MLELWGQSAGKRADLRLLQGGGRSPAVRGMLSHEPARSRSLRSLRPRARSRASPRAGGLALPGLRSAIHGHPDRGQRTSARMHGLRWPVGRSHEPPNSVRAPCSALPGLGQAARCVAFPCDDPGSLPALSHVPAAHEPPKLWRAFGRHRGRLSFTWRLLRPRRATASPCLRRPRWPRGSRSTGSRARTRTAQIHCGSGIPYVLGARAEQAPRPGHDHSEPPLRHPARARQISSAARVIHRKWTACG